jgi:hypothetical protein
MYQSAINNLLVTSQIKYRVIQQTRGRKEEEEKNSEPCGWASDGRRGQSPACRLLTPLHLPPACLLPSLTPPTAQRQPLVGGRQRGNGDPPAKAEQGTVDATPRQTPHWTELVVGIQQRRCEASVARPCW